MVNAGVEVKVEDYDGTYVCLFCGESVRGQPALKCSHCSSNPFHLACVALAHSKYGEVCPTCDRKTVAAWGRASGGAAGAGEIIDLREVESEGEGGAEVAKTLCKASIDAQPLGRAASTLAQSISMD